MEDENLTAQADTVAPEVAPAPVPEPAPVTFGSAIAALHRAATVHGDSAQVDAPAPGMSGMPGAQGRRKGRFPLSGARVRFASTPTRAAP